MHLANCVGLPFFPKLPHQNISNNKSLNFDNADQHSLYREMVIEYSGSILSEKLLECRSEREQRGPGAQL